MNLQAHYDAMRNEAFGQLAQGAASLDTLIDSMQDDRRGITLLTRPPAQITSIIETILADFQLSEPHQYYYPSTDMHLTVLSIISCHSGFKLTMINPEVYQQAIHTILQQVRPFNIRFAGLTASRSGIIVQGLPQDDGLEKLRDQTRQYFRHSGLQQSIDQRYSLQTAHVTVIRFKSAILNTDALLEKIKKYQHHFIGSFEVNTLELVYNDWYQRASNTILLEKYLLEPVIIGKT